MSVTVVLADDHDVVRLGLRSLLEGEPGIEVVGDAANGVDLLPLLSRLHPNVLLLDLMLPGMAGLEVLRQLPKHSPRTRCVVLSMYASEAYVYQAFLNHASAYVCKGAPGGEIVQAVREAAAGRRYLSPPLSEESLANYAAQGRGAEDDGYESLTAREREVLKLTAEGLTSTEVGRRLFISPRTVEGHRAHVLEKLGLETQRDLVRYALRHGIIPLDE